AGTTLRLFPCIWSNLRPVIRPAVASLAAAGIACAAAPAAEQLQTIAPGVRVFGTHVGGLTIDPARARVQRALDRPISIVYRGDVLTVTPRALGASAGVDRALQPALTARQRARAGLHGSYSGDAVERYVATLARQYNRAPRPARIVGADASGPIIRDGRLGLAVEETTLRAAIEQELASGARRPLVLLMDAVRPKRSAYSFGDV